MRPLLFVNWRQLSTRFTALMWIVACVLALVLLMHLAADTATAPAARPGASHLNQGRLATVPSRLQR